MTMRTEWQSVDSVDDVQLDEFCRKMKQDPKLADGVNIVGFSQGGLLVRAYVERCNDPPVKNLVSYLGPQMGVYGVPRVPTSFPHAQRVAAGVAHLPRQICWIPYVNTTLDTLVGTFIYSEWAQDLFSFAGYWRGETRFPSLRRLTLRTHLPACRSVSAGDIPQEVRVPARSQQRRQREEPDLQAKPAISGELRHGLLRR